MHLKRLITLMRDCKKYRHDYKIIWNFHAFTDYTDYLFCLLPTIYWQPWPCRITNTCVFEIHWLNLHICLFKWVSIRDGRKADE